MAKLSHHRHAVAHHLHSDRPTWQKVLLVTGRALWLIFMFLFFAGVVQDRRHTRSHGHH